MNSKRGPAVKHKQEQEPKSKPEITIEIPSPFYSNSVFVSKQRFDVQFDFMLTQTIISDDNIKEGQEIKTERRVVKIFPVTMTLEHAAAFHGILANVLAKAVEEYKMLAQAESQKNV